MSDKKVNHTELINEYINNYMGKIFYYCLKKTSNKNEAEELTQDITLNVISSLNKGNSPKNFSAWVWQITRNTYSKWAKDKSNNSKNINSIDINNIEVIDENDDVINNIIHEEQLSRLRRELAFIKSDYNNIIVAYYLENKSVKDIANSLSLSVDVIHQRLHRARETLKEGMNMERTFGKRSYNPENISFINNGSLGKNGQPWSILSHLMYKNIFLESYKNPSTAEQLALELGISLPYMKEELEFLVNEELLKKVNDKYETNFDIVSKEEQLNMHLACEKVKEPLTEKICELIDLLFKDNDNVITDYVGYENAKWTLLMRVFDDLYYTCFPMDSKMPKRPNDGQWKIVGYEFPVEFKKPDFVGYNGSNTKNNGEKLHFNVWQYKFFKYHLASNTPEFLSFGDAKALGKIYEGKINECRKENIDNLLEYEHIKEVNGNYILNMVVFKEIPFNLICNADNNLKSLVNDIYSLLKKAPSIERGYILDQALEAGWLHYDKNTPKNVGAFMIY